MVNKNYIIAGLFLVMIIAGALFTVRENNWRELKSIDDQKMAVDNRAMTACVNGWDASTSFKIADLDTAVTDLGQAREDNKAVIASREAQLKKLNY